MKVCEPEEFHGKYLGFHYYGRIVVYLGTWCGYVAIPKGNPFADEGRMHDLQTPHGGVTYHEWDKNRFWIGFDCAHWLDTVPAIEPIIGSSYITLGATYKDRDYVEQTCKDIIDEIIERS